MITGNSNKEIQSAVLAAIENYRQTDMLAPVTLLVSSPSQGWLLRRQLAQQVPLNSGLPNLHIYTASEFLSFCLRIATGKTITSENRIVQSIEAEKILETETGELAPAKMHTGTLQLMLNLAEEVQWCELDKEVINKVEEKSTNTSASSLRFVQRLRTELTGASSLRFWSEVVNEIQSSGRQGFLSEKCGLVISLLSQTPSAISNLLSWLNRGGAETISLYWPEGNEHINPNFVYSCPSPSIEAKVASQRVAQWISQGVTPGEIAVVYPVSSPYANLLSAEFDSAKLSWHGNSGATLASRDLPRVAIIIAEMAAERSKNQPALTRFRFMRWLSATRISIEGKTVWARKIRKLIQDENLYAEAENWIEPLTALMNVEISHVDNDADSTKKKTNKLLASDLITLVTALNETVSKISEAKSWATAGAELFNFLEKYHPGSKFNLEEQEIREQVRGLLISSLGELGGEDAFPAQALPQLLIRQFQGRQLSSGSKSIGVHLGTISSTQLLSYKYVVLLGAGEGLLPSVKSNNPLLPEEARNVLRGDFSDNLPPLSHKILREITVVNWFLKSATESIVTYPRGGHSSVSSGRASSLLNTENEKVLKSAIEAISEFNPVNDTDVEIRKILANGVGEKNLEKQKSAALLWWQPEISDLFGVVSSIGLEDFENLRISSSGLEAFVSCPHNYFAGRILGIRSDQFDDDIDTISAADFGSLLHESFEEFYFEIQDDLKISRNLPADSIEKITTKLNAKSDQAIAKGFVGWLPAWEQQHNRVISLLPIFIELDSQVRDNGALIPSGFEQAFSVEVQVDGSKVFLNGFIDRIDKSDDGKTLSIVDYKSGSDKDFKRLNEEDLAKRKKLQDLVYDTAARKLFEDVESVQVKYIFFPNLSGNSRVIASPEIDREALLQEALLSVKNAFVAGKFPIGDPSNKYCPVCKFFGRRAVSLASAQEGDEDE